MKKVYSLVALPLVAATCLFGCGKTERSVEELTTLHSDIVSAHTITTDVKDGFYTLSNNVEEAFYVVYNNEAGLNTAVQASINSESTDLQIRYSQLSTVYARTMTLAYSYYQNFKDVFYSNIGEKEYEKDELSELYDRLKAFQRELEDFNTARKDLEREVNLFGVDGQVVSAKVDSFNTDYTDMIETTLNFVNYFRDLHVKYFYPAGISVDQSYAKRVYNDGLLTLANFIYYDYLVALEENGATNTTYLNKDAETLNIFRNSTFNGLIAKGNKDASTLNATLLTNLDSQDEATKNAAISKVQEFEVALNTYNQYFELYKEVFGKVSMSKYNNYRFKTNGGYGSVDEYLNDLSVVDAANVRVLIDIEKDRTTDFLGAFALYKA